MQKITLVCINCNREITIEKEKGKTFFGVTCTGCGQFVDVTMISDITESK